MPGRDRPTVFPVVVVSALLMTGCGPTVNLEQERTALMTADREWSASTKDLDKFLSYLTPDATVAGPGMKSVKSPDAVRATFKEMMAAPGFGLSWTADRAVVAGSGELGYTAGTFKVTLNNPAGSPSTETGNYVTVWKKVNGAWKAFDDIASPDSPPPMTATAPVVVANSSLKWGDAPPVLPKGAKMAVVAGDPSKPAHYVLRLQMPNGYRIAPHWHPTDEHVTVLSGTFAAAMGQKFDEGALKDLAPGSYANMAATMPHFAMAKGPTTVQVDGVGPFVVNYVNAADDPSKK